MLITITTSGILGEPKGSPNPLRSTLGRAQRAHMNSKTRSQGGKGDEIPLKRAHMNSKTRSQGGKGDEIPLIQ